MDITGAKERALLSVLVAWAGTVVTTERLIDALWGERPPRTSAKVLQNLVLRLRKALGPELIETRAGGYVLRAAPETVDICRFDRLVREGRQRVARGAWEAAAAALLAAIELWRGNPLEEVGEWPPIREICVRLHEERLSLHEELAAVELACRRHREWVATLETMVSEEPFRERRWALLMLALYRSGRRADALRAFQGARAALAELGLEPGSELVSLERAIAARDDLLAIADNALRDMADIGGAPSGTLTFLFTDIEDSTRLWDEHPSAMRMAVERHDAIVRSAIEGHGGYIFSTGGDAFCAAFPRAQGAVEAALETQCALTAETWPEACPIHVRIGVHSGDAVERDGNYFGPVVNRAARVMSVGHGGRVLVSSTVERLVRDSPEPTWSLRPLGEVQLRGLGRGEELFELRYPGLDRDYPPLAALALRRGRLPLAPDELIGRDRVLGEALALVSVAPVVTLVGPGGVGKTRLAIEVGEELIDQRRDGVWFCELAPVGTDDGVVYAVAEVLEVRETARQPLADSIVGALVGRDLVLILDNCEHVLGGARPLAEAIATRCGTVVVLATSREQLGVRGERILPVPPLAVPDVTAPRADAPAVRLFVERATAADPSLTLTDVTLTSIGSICRQLDGMPLALELAAARVRGLGLEGLAGRLDDRLRLLRNPGEADPRHQTLRTTVGWSYDLLDDDQRSLFRRASVFAGGFTLESAEHVLAFGGLDAVDVVEGVANLVDKSMLQTVDTPAGRRYRMLETLRQFAGELVDPNERVEAERRLIAHFVAWIATADQGVRGPDPGPWFDVINAELDNLREVYRLSSGSADLGSAARLVVSLNTFTRHAMVGEPFSWAGDLADRLTPTDVHFGEVLAIAARGSRDRAARSDLLSKIVAAETDGVLQPTALVDHVAAVTLWYLGRTEAAVARHERALTKARTDGDWYIEAWSLAGLSMAQDSFDRARAVASARAAIEVARASRSSLTLGIALLALALTLLHNEPEQALPVIEEMLKVANSSGDRWSQAVALRLRAHALSRASRLGEASTAFADALALNEVGEYGELLWYTVLNVIEHFRRVDRLETAGVALGAFEAAPAAPMDALVQHALDRFRRTLDNGLGVDRRLVLEAQGRALNLAEFLHRLDGELRRHAASSI